MSWFDDVRAMKAGDPCEFRFPQSREWRAGVVMVNAGPGFWTLRDRRTGEEVTTLYAEHVRAPGGKNP